ELAGELLQDERYPPVRRLVHVLQYAGFLSAAKTAKMTDPQVIELASTLAELASEESKPFFSDRQSPTGYSKVLFRLMAVDCARLHPECEHKSQWFARLQLMKLAWKVANGTGSTPCIGRVYGRMKFEELEKPLVAMRPEIYLPLNRFVETMSASYMYAIADRQGWSVVESIRGLAMLFPVGLWLLKWISCGREPTVNDMLSIVVSLDRSQGYAPLVGSLHRRRLAVLSHNSQLERVVVWYAR
ncbi:MAG: hypothetical protein IT423_08625, partial [Pirellulaceae bacterium]|nr:hypothetical protein [Pirellulaceae bacterium]